MLRTVTCVIFLLAGLACCFAAFGSVGGGAYLRGLGFFLLGLICWSIMVRIADGEFIPLKRKRSGRPAQSASRSRPGA